jgi:hypothetical protein
MKISGGVFAVCLAVIGCSSGVADNPPKADGPETTSVAQALTAADLHGRCMHMARDGEAPSYATSTTSSDSDVRGRAIWPNAAHATQVWCFDAVAGQTNTYRIMDAEQGRYLDAYQSSGDNYRVVLRPNQSNTTQHWVVSSVGAFGSFRFRQVSTQRYLDSYFGSNDDQFVTRTFQDDSTQRFFLFEVGGRCNYQSISWNSTACSLSVSCLYPPSDLLVSCEHFPDGQSSCACDNVSSGETTWATLVTVDSRTVCEAALYTCVND